MNIRKLTTTGIVAFTAATASALLFSENQSQLQLNPKETKQISTKLKSDKNVTELLTLDQAKSKGLVTHTYPRKHNALVGEDGIKYLAFDTGKGYQLFIVEKDKKVSAKDGTYKLKDGGEVRVKGGLIVWSNAVINSRFPNPGYVSGVIGLG
jgi:hypothetical protein